MEFITSGFVDIVNKIIDVLPECPFEALLTNLEQSKFAEYNSYICYFIPMKELAQIFFIYIGALFVIVKFILFIEAVIK